MFQSLSSIAEGHEPRALGTWLHDDQLRASVSRAVGDWSNLSSIARSCLHELMLSIDDDYEAASRVSTSLSGLAAFDPSGVNALSHALALRSIAVGPKVLANYAELMATKAKNEPAFHRFFENQPLLLDPRAFQVWSKPDLHGKLEPDFLIRTYENKYVVVEIETPSKQLVTREYQLSADATHAITQVLHYQEYLNAHSTVAKEVFDEFSNPAGLVVIGCESSLNTGQKAVLRLENLSRPGITIVGFDTLAATAKTNMDNVIHGISRAVTGMRLP